MRSLELYILAYLLNSLWQVPLLFAMGWPAMRMLRLAGARAEHRGWVVVLVLQSVLPAFSLLPLQWLRFGSLWSWHASTAQGAQILMVMGSGAGLRETGVAGVWVATITLAYATVLGYFVARFVWRTRMLSRMRRQAVPVCLSGRAAACWARCQRDFGTQQVSLVASSLVGAPVTMGVRRKLVLLPVSMIDVLPEVDLETILAHEFAHMRRNDFTKNLLYELLSLPVAYHPLLWFTRAQIMESREILCDQMALGMHGRREYAQSLLRLARLMVEGALVRTPHTIGIFDANAFERRIMMLTVNRKEVRGWRRAFVVAACAALGFAVCNAVVTFAMHAETFAAGSGEGAAQPPRSLSIPSAVMQKNILTKAVPHYPEAAKKAKIQGTVVLIAVISKEGLVESLRALSGPKELQQSALDAVRQWTYKPYLLNGDPIEIKTTVNIVFSLNG